jgi:hypothetical protein
LVKLESEMQRLAAMEKLMLASPDQQISLTDPDNRSMATSGRGSGVVGYNVQVAVDTDHHLIIAHEVTNTGSKQGFSPICGHRADKLPPLRAVWRRLSCRIILWAGELLAKIQGGIPTPTTKRRDSLIRPVTRFACYRAPFRLPHCSRMHGTPILRTQHCVGFRTVPPPRSAEITRS